MKPWDIVLVYWVDSSGIGSWTDSQKVLDENWESNCWTAGFFVGYSDYCIKMASSASNTDSMDHIMYIPKVCIKKIKVIGKQNA